MQQKNSMDLLGRKEETTLQQSNMKTQGNKGQ
jgi:hypothetical protein